MKKLLFFLLLAVLLVAGFFFFSEKQTPSAGPASTAQPSVSTASSQTPSPTAAQTAAFWESKERELAEATAPLPGIFPYDPRFSGATLLLSESRPTLGEDGSQTRTSIVRIGDTSFRLVDKTVPGSPSIQPISASLADSVLVRTRPSADERAFASSLAACGFPKPEKLGSPNLFRVRIPNPLSPDALPIAIGQLRLLPEVESADPDAVLTPCATPNDPDFSWQWALHNTAPVLAYNITPTLGVDMNLPAAWDIQPHANSQVIAVVDGAVYYGLGNTRGYDFSHAFWTNPGENASNGSDDDGNGFVNDIYGWNFAKNSNAVIQTNASGSNHALALTSILSSKSNDASRNSGVAPGAKLLYAAYYDSNIVGVVSNLISALEYARAKGAKIILCPFTTTDNNAALYAKCNELRNAGAILVVAAGNAAYGGSPVDLDQNPLYPACFDLDNIVTVAALNVYGMPWDKSNYGRKSVDLFAPGEYIWTESSLKMTETGYTQYPDLTTTVSGTSYASAHVAGILALLKEKFPSETYLQTINRLLGGTSKVTASNQILVDQKLAKAPAVTKCWLTEVCRTGGMADAEASLNLTSLSDFPTLDSGISDVTAKAGASVSWTVSASAGSTVSWYKDDTAGTTPAIATGNTLTLANVQSTDNALYTVQAKIGTNYASSNARLTVLSENTLLKTAVDGTGMTNLVCFTYGDAEWTTVSSSNPESGVSPKTGTTYIRSGAIPDISESSFEFQFTAPSAGTLNFWLLVKTDSADKASFTINGLRMNNAYIYKDGSPSLFTSVVSGTDVSSWREVKMEVAAGLQIVKITYAKDKADSASNDAVYLDGIRFVADEKLPPMLVTAPFSQTVYQNNSASFVTDFRGTGNTYQWFRKQGATTEAISGATSETYTLANAQPADASWKYFVTATNSAGSVSCPETSISVIPVTLPSITAHPQNQTLAAGSYLSLSVAGTGEPSPSCQWKKNGSPISGQTAFSLAIPSISAADAGSYTATLTNAGGSATSNAATVSVVDATGRPTITSFPASTEGRENAAVSLAASASGDATLSYQWFKDGSAISGATSATYSIPAMSASDAGSYQLRVTNSIATAWSTPCLLSLLAGDASFAEGLDCPSLTFYQGQTLNITPWRVTVEDSWDGEDSMEFPQPKFSGSVADPSFSFFETVVQGPSLVRFRIKGGHSSSQFLITRDGTSVYDSLGSTENTWKTLEIPLTSGSHVLRWQNNFPTLSDLGAYSHRWLVDRLEVFPYTGNPPILTSQPSDTSCGTGGSASFSVAAVGAGTISYQWFKDGSAISGATSASYTVSSASAAKSGLYHCVLSNANGSTRSLSARLSVFSGSTPAISASLAEAADWTSQTFTSSVPSGGKVNAQNTVTHDSSDAVELQSTNDYTSAYIQTTVQGPGIISFWRKRSFVSSSHVNFSFRTRQAGTGSFTALTDPNPAEADWVFASYYLDKNQQYDLQWYLSININYSPNPLSGFLDQVLWTPQTNLPLLSQNLTDSDWIEGEKVTLTVASPNSLGYQWKKNGIAIPGATSASLALPFATPSDSGSYQCSVSNASGTILSAAASVRVFSKDYITEALDMENQGFSWKQKVRLNFTDGSATSTPIRYGVALDPRDNSDSSDDFLVTAGQAGSITVLGESQTSGVTTDLKGLACDASGVYVAVGLGGKILTSSNKTTWVLQGSPVTTNLEDVEWTGKELLACGASTVLLRSIDHGATWTQIPLTGMPSATLYGVASDGNSHWVVVGASGKIYSSDNAGSTWTNRSGPAGTTQLNNLLWDGQQFVAVGNSGKILTSPDGASWTVRPTGTTKNLMDIAITRNRLERLMVTGSQVFLTSTNGDEWRMLSLDVATQTLIRAGRYIHTLGSKTYSTIQELMDFLPKNLGSDGSDILRNNGPVFDDIGISGYNSLESNVPEPGSLTFLWRKKNAGEEVEWKETIDNEGTLTLAYYYGSAASTSAYSVDDSWQRQSITLTPNIKKIVISAGHVLELDQMRFIPDSGKETYESWQTLHFSPSELAIPSVSSPTADPDSDGRSNLEEYALGGDPKNPADASTILPYFRNMETFGTLFRSLLFRERIRSTDLSYEWQFRDASNAWSVLPDYTVVQSANLSSDVRQIQFRDSSPSSFLGSRTYRLQISCGNDSVFVSPSESDSEAPFWTAGFPQYTNIAATSFDIQARTNETATVYFVVLPQGSPAPSSAQVKAGTSSSGSPATRSGSAAAPALTTVTLPVSGLGTTTTYAVYTVAEDAASNLQASPTFSEVATIDTTPPAWAPGYPTLTATTSEGFTLNFSLNEAGAAAFVVVASGSGTPTAAQILAGKNASDSAAIASGSQTLSANTPASRSVTGLSMATTYAVFVVGRDASSNTTAISEFPVTTLSDVNPPAWGYLYPKAQNIGVAGFDLLLQTDEAATAFYAIYANNASTPTAAQVKTGTGALASGSTSLSANTEKTVAISGLSSSTNYDIFVVAQDTNPTPNLQATASKLDVLTATPPDFTAPVWTGGFPSLAASGPYALSLSLNTDEAGKAYYGVYPDGATPPDAAALKAGTGALFYGSTSLAATTTKAVALGGLQASTPYDVYAIAEDDEPTPNSQTTPSKTEASTSAPSDSSGPALSYAFATGATTAVVQFNERLDATSATSAFNYSLDGGVAVLSASLHPYHENAVLLTTETMSTSRAHWLTVSGVKDSGNNPIAANSKTPLIRQSENTNGDLAQQNRSRYGSRAVPNFAFSFFHAGQQTQTTSSITITKPKGYDLPENASRQYNTLFVFDGAFSDSAAGFDFVEVCDRLSDEGLIDPVIIVGVGNPDAGGRDGLLLGSSLVTDSILSPLITYMDTNYRTVADPQHRVIAGHSYGGYAAFKYGWEHYDKIANVFALSPGIYAASMNGGENVMSWPANSGASKVNNLKMVIEAGGSETSGFYILPIASSMSTAMLTAGFRFGEDFGFIITGRYHDTLTRHDEVKGSIAGYSGLYMLLKKSPLALTSVEIAPMDTTDFLSAKGDIGSSHFKLSTNQTQQINLVANFGKFCRLNYPKYAGVWTSENPSMLEVINTGSAPDFSDFCVAESKDITGSVLLHGSLVYAGQTYDATAGFDIGTVATPLYGTPAGPRGGTNQRPSQVISSLVLSSTLKTSSAFSPAQDPDSDPLHYLPRLSLGAWEKRAPQTSNPGYDVTSYPGNIAFSSSSSPEFDFFPAGGKGRATFLYSANDGGLESLPSFAVLHFGYAIPHTDASSLSISMSQANAAAASWSRQSVSVTNIGADSMPAPFVKGLPSWLTASVGGSPASYGISFALNPTSANTLSPGNYSATVRIATGRKTVLLPEADSAVSSGNASDKGFLDAATVSNTQTYIARFDLAQLPGRVSKATIRFRGKFPTAPKLYAFTNDSWDEASASGTSLGYPLPVAGALGQFTAWDTGTDPVVGYTWQEFDVTSYIESQRTGDSKASFAIRDESAGLANYLATREDNAVSPEIVIYCDGASYEDTFLPVSVSLSVTERDVAPPSWASGFPTTSNVTSSGFDLSAQCSETAKAYFVVLANNAAAPSIAQVKNGLDASSAAALSAGWFAVNASSPSSYTVTGLAASTSYDVYLVAEDSASSPNTQSLVTKLNAATASSGGSSYTMLFDFGASGTPTSGNWNNVTNVAVATPIANAINSTGATTGVSLAITDAFGNTGASTFSPYTTADFPMNAKGDFFKLLATNPTGVIKLSDLSTSMRYDFTFLGSGTQVADSELNITIGSTTVTAATYNNDTGTCSIPSVAPQPDGTITITVSTGGSGATFLSLMKVVAAGAASAPAQWLPGFPSYSNVTTTSVTLSAKADKAATAWFVLLPQGSSAPSASEVKAGTGASGATASRSGSIALSADTAASSSLTSLTSSATYDIYFALDDAVSGLLPSVEKITVSLAFPEAAVSRNSAIPSSGTDSASGLQPGVTSSLIYRIDNEGLSNLTLGSASVSAASNCSTNISQQPMGPVPAGASTQMVVAVTPTAPGPWQFTLSIPTNDPDENPYSWTVSGTSGSDPFASWLTGFGLSGGSALASADPDGDGLDNLLEYALNSSPVTATGEDLPQISLSGSDLVIRYRKLASSSALVYSVEGSDDLVSWSALGSGTKESDLDADTQIWKLSLPAPTSGKKFLRLKIVK